jgi:hypothetical protein
VQILQDHREIFEVRNMNSLTEIQSESGYQSRDSFTAEEHELPSVQIIETEERNSNDS